MLERYPPVYCVVLNWNNYGDTASCLRSVLNVIYPNLQILLIDNGSSDGSGEKLKKQFAGEDRLSIKLKSKNLGFSGGCNLGMKIALDRGAKYVWLLNNDTCVKNKKILHRHISIMQANVRIGLISPLIRNYPDTETYWFIQGSLNAETGGIQRNRNGNIGNAHEDLLENDHIPLCSALIRRDVLDEIGYLDDDYFLYLEDTDFSIRARKAGYRLCTDTKTEIYHKESGSAGSFSTISGYYLSRNRLQLYRKHTDVFGNQIIKNYLIWLIFEAYLYFRSGGYESGMSVLKGAKDGFMGRHGKVLHPRKIYKSTVENAEE